MEHQHPGAYIRDEVIGPLGLSVTNAARVLGVTRPALSALLNARASLTPEMALRIEKAFGQSMDELLQIQTSFDIAQARRRQAQIEVEPFVAANELSASGSVRKVRRG